MHQLGETKIITRIRLNASVNASYYSKIYFAEAFKSAQDVIQLDDRDNNVMIGKGNLPTYFIAGMWVGDYRMNFSVKISCKDNRYRYSIYDITFVNNNPEGSTYGNGIPSNIFVESYYYKKNGTARPFVVSWKNKTLEAFHHVSSKIKELMSKPANSEDDW